MKITQDLIVKINSLIDEKYESLKSESADYQELKNNLEKVERDIAWENPKIAGHIKKRFQEMLYKEVQNIAFGQKSIRTKLIEEREVKEMTSEKQDFQKIKKAVLVEVIRTGSVEGDGTQENPVRTVVRHWGKDGRLIGEEIQ